jgi:hypothetical protein
MRKSYFLIMAPTAILALSFAALSLAQERADTGKVLGTWNLEVFAGDQTYSLNLTVTEESGQLAGKISESLGTFMDVAISDIFYDGVIFRFSFISPTPPDGSSRTVKADLKLSGDTMGGTLTVPDLDVVVEARASRAK